MLSKSGQLNDLKYFKKNHSKECVSGDQQSTISLNILEIHNWENERMEEMLNPKEELTVCDTIDLRKIGYIQNHGSLVVLDPLRKQTLALDENFDDFFANIERNELLAELEKQIPQKLPLQAVDCVPISFQIGQKSYSLSCHQTALGLVIAELEPKREELLSNDYIENYLKKIQKTCANATEMNDLLGFILKSMRELTQFNRVMVYKFHPDLHGEVIAEDKISSIESFLGLHYPASDIPKLARKLYLSNRTRYISDVNSNPKSIKFEKGQEPEIDLSGSILRSVSPVHLQYLKNMGVCSSVSISLIVEGKLWGLVACHHCVATYPSASIRNSFDFLSYVFSASIERVIAVNRNSYFQKRLNTANNLISFDDGQENLGILAKNDPSVLLDIISADSCIIIKDGRVSAISSNSNLDDVNIALNYFKDLGKKTQIEIESSNKVDFGVENSFKGFLYIPTSNENDSIVFLRRELIRQINWAGSQIEKTRVLDPMDPQRLEPRASFSLWSEEVTGCSLEWSEEDIEQAKLLQVLFTTYWVGHLKQKNKALLLSSKELNLFFRAVHHDIKNPLLSISYNLGFLEKALQNLPEKTARFISRIRDSAQRIDRILNDFNFLPLVNEARNREHIDPSVILKKCRDEVHDNYPKLSVTFENIPTDLVFSRVHFECICINILTNAAKYAGDSPEINVKYVHIPQSRIHEFRFCDKGPGVNDDSKHFIFFPFASKKVEGISGTGLGLSLCRRILNYYGGSISIEDNKPNGSIFIVKFPKMF